MKTIYSIFILLTAFLIQGCERTLEEKPQTILSPNQFFSESRKL